MLKYRKKQWYSCSRYFGYGLGYKLGKFQIVEDGFFNLTSKHEYDEGE